MKIRSSVKKICKNCQLIKRSNKLYILCKKKRKHKQRQG